MKTRRGRWAAAGWVVALSITFGPLAWMHVFHPEEVGQRFRYTRIWQEHAPLPQKMLSVLARYPCHFGPSFLFIDGDRLSQIQSPPASGQFHFYMLPLMLLGLAVLARRAWSSQAARVVLVMLLVYPLGDCLARWEGAHALRSLPGLCGLILLAALGGVQSVSWLYRRARAATWAAVAVFATIVVTLNGRFLYHFFGEFNRRPIVYHSFHVDLMEACAWLRPRLDTVDAVFCTTEYMNMPYSITLVALGYDPRQWLRDAHDIEAAGEWDHHKRYGKFYFVYDASGEKALQEMIRSKPGKHVVVITRQLVAGPAQPALRIIRPGRQPVLFVYELNI